MWQGASGRWYEFEVVRAKRDWEVAGAVYLFVKPPEQPALDWGGPICLFVARTTDLSQSLARHEMWQAAENLGAREIHVLLIKEEQSRQEVERDLLDAQQPILNRSLLRRVA